MPHVLVEGKVEIKVVCELSQNKQNKIKRNQIMIIMYFFLHLNFRIFFYIAVFVGCENDQSAN